MALLRRLPAVVPGQTTPSRFAVTGCGYCAPMTMTIGYFLSCAEAVAPFADGSSPRRPRATSTATSTGSSPGTRQASTRSTSPISGPTTGRSSLRWRRSPSCQAPMRDPARVRVRPAVDGLPGLVGGTPLLRMRRLFSDADARVFAKLESFNGWERQGPAGCGHGGGSTRLRRAASR